MGSLDLVSRFGICSGRRSSRMVCWWQTIKQIFPGENSTFYVVTFVIFLSALFHVGLQRFQWIHFELDSKDFVVTNFTGFVVYQFFCKFRCSLANAQLSTFPVSWMIRYQFMMPSEFGFCKGEFWVPTRPTLGWAAAHAGYDAFNRPLLGDNNFRHAGLNLQTWKIFRLCFGEVCMRCVEMTRLMRGTNHLVAQKVLCAFRIQQMSIPTVHFSVMSIVWFSVAVM